MIDLRSDTLTVPDSAMLESILTARLGDDGRPNGSGRGEDETTNQLEDYAAQLIGKDAGLFFSSGTLANTCALLTWCSTGDGVLVDALQHIYRSEKAAFAPHWGKLVPQVYRYSAANCPDVPHMEALLSESNSRLICLENTHNARGGAVIPLETMGSVRKLADQFSVPVHMDGARIFNAAHALKIDARELCSYADSVMFCVSKGLRAPVGSLLCGSTEFICRARATRKLLGGNMRQCGVIAAPALYALRHNIADLCNDNRNALIFSDALKPLRIGRVQPCVESNIVMLDVSPYGLSADEYCNILGQRGVLASIGNIHQVRFVFYCGISQADSRNAAAILLKLEQDLSR